MDATQSSFTPFAFRYFSAEHCLAERPKRLARLLHDLSSRNFAIGDAWASPTQLPSSPGSLNETTADLA